MSVFDSWNGIVPVTLKKHIESFHPRIVQHILRRAHIKLFLKLSFGIGIHMVNLSMYSHDSRENNSFQQHIVCLLFWYFLFMFAIQNKF